MVTGDTGVHIWAVPGNVAGGFRSPSGNVTILCKYQPTPMFFALGFLHSVNTREIYSDYVVFLGQQTVENIVWVHVNDSDLVILT